MEIRSDVGAACDVFVAPNFKTGLFLGPSSIGQGREITLSFKCHEWIPSDALQKEIKAFSWQDVFFFV